MEKNGFQILFVLLETCFYGNCIPLLNLFKPDGKNHVRSEWGSLETLNNVQSEGVSRDPKSCAFRRGVTRDTIKLPSDQVF